MSNEWKRNRGRKSLPVPAGTLVDVVHRDGSVYEGVKCGRGMAHLADWAYSGCSDDIVKWRLHEPSAKLSDHVTVRTELTGSVTPFDGGKLMDDAPAEQGWIKWEGGVRPADIGQQIEARMRSGRTLIDVAGNWEWSHCGGRGDIIAYRLASPATKVPVPTAPTIDQLIQSWRELTDRAAAAQAEADSLAVQVNQAADAVTAALAGAGWGVHAVEMTMSFDQTEPGPDMTDWRNWRVGDAVKIIADSACHNIPLGEIIRITRFDPDDQDMPIRTDRQGIWLGPYDGQWISRPTQP